MQWYYLDTNKQQVPFDENYVQALAHDGTINAQTLTWNERLPEWQSAAASFPQSFGQQQAIPQQQISPPAGMSQQGKAKMPVRMEESKMLNHDLRELVKDLASYLSANAKWIRFFGIILIISGIAQLIFLYGALFIWLGVILMKAASQAEIALKTGTNESLERCLYQIGRFFKINGIVLLVLLILYIGAIIAVLSMELLAPFLGGGIEPGL